MEFVCSLRRLSGVELIGGYGPEAISAAELHSIDSKESTPFHHPWLSYEINKEKTSASYSTNFILFNWIHGVCLLLGWLKGEWSESWCVSELGATTLNQQPVI